MSSVSTSMDISHSQDANMAVTNRRPSTSSTDSVEKRAVIANGRRPTTTLRSSDNKDADEERTPPVSDDDNEERSEKNNSNLKDLPLTSPAPSAMQAFEIDMDEGDMLITEDELEEGVALGLSRSKSTDSQDSEDDGEFNRLLRNSPKRKKKKPKDGKSSSSSKHRILEPTCCFRHAETVGGVRILCPAIFDKTGWGCAGPHWFGPPCVIALIGFASSVFIRKSWEKIGPGTTVTCTLFSIACTYNLINTAYRDPGIVVLMPPPSEDEIARNRRKYRWCDICQAYQPESAVHCPNCNICVAGYDHHCVWMGACIGRKNMKQFVKFNLTWLLFLVYAIVWVSLAGPAIVKRTSHHVGDHDHFNDTNATSNATLPPS